MSFHAPPDIITSAQGRLMPPPNQLVTKDKKRLVFHNFYEQDRSHHLDNVRFLRLDRHTGLTIMARHSGCPWFCLIVTLAPEIAFMQREIGLRYLDARSPVAGYIPNRSPKEVDRPYTVECHVTRGLDKQLYCALFIHDLPEGRIEFSRRQLYAWAAQTGQPGLADLVASSSS